MLRGKVLFMLKKVSDLTSHFPETWNFFLRIYFLQEFNSCILIFLDVIGTWQPQYFVTFCPRNSENCDFFTEVLFPGFFQKLFFPATFLHKLYVAGNYDYKEHDFRTVVSEVSCFVDNPGSQKI